MKRIRFQPMLPSAYAPSATRDQSGACYFVFVRGMEAWVGGRVVGVQDSHRCYSSSIGQSIEGVARPHSTTTPRESLGRGGPSQKHRARATQAIEPATDKRRQIRTLSAPDCSHSRSQTHRLNGLPHRLREAEAQGVKVEAEPGGGPEREQRQHLQPPGHRQGRRLPLLQGRGCHDDGRVAGRWGVGRARRWAGGAAGPWLCVCCWAWGMTGSIDDR